MIAALLDTHHQLVMQALVGCWVFCAQGDVTAQFLQVLTMPQAAKTITGQELLIPCMPSDAQCPSDISTF